MSQRTVVTVRSNVSWAALSTAVVLATLLGTVPGGVLAGRAPTLETLSHRVALFASALALTAAASVYGHWRLVTIDRPTGLNRALSGWLVAGLVLAAIPHVALEASRQTSDTGLPTSLLATQLVIAAVLILITWVSERTELATDPAFIGTVAGLVLTAGGCLLALAWPELRVGSVGRGLAGSVLVLSGIFLARTLLRRTDISTWVRQRLALSAAALVVAQGLGHVDGAVAAGGSIIGNVLGALVLCATAWRLLRETMQEFHEEVLVMHSALHEKAVVVHEQQQLLHELGSTLAGIAAASEIIRDEPQLHAPRRRRLEGMLESEVSRLVRLVGTRPRSRVIEAIDVDAVLGTIVLSHQTRGADVRWRPSGLTAMGSADNLAEAVNILLENAARHAAGAPVTVSAKASEGTVQIVCSDLGPGIPADLRGRLFDTGTRGSDSRGQGLGLSIARRILGEIDGSLVHRHTESGATFVIRIPQRVEARRRSDVIAHAS